ncbi:MAG: hypothetical protein ACYDAC_04695 [Candidatus Dormibacteria bacterium]
MTNPPEAPPPPPPPPGAALSPDGTHWWSGQEWVPLAQSDAPPPQPHLGFWARHKLEVAHKHYAEQMREWQTQVDGLTDYLHLIDTFAGDSDVDGLVLKAGETAFGTIGASSLVETRVSSGHWVSGSTGFSFPVGSLGGHAIRYRVGATRGHFVRGEPTPTAIDAGSTSITSQRIIFAGANQTRECQYAKLVGYRHGGGEVTLSVSNRQKPVTVHYGASLDAWFVERFELALAHFRGTVATLRQSVAAMLEEADQHEPVDPAAPTPH